jgi:predicted secreted protein
MADIQFQEDQEFSRRDTAPAQPTFVRLVLKTGIVSTKTQAEYVLIGFSVLLLILAFLIPSFVGPSQQKVPQSVIDAAMKTPANYQR